MSAQLIGGHHREGSIPLHVLDEYSDCESRNGLRPRVMVSPTKPEPLSKVSSEASLRYSNHSVENENADQLARRKGANGLTDNHFVVAKRNSKTTVCILPEEKPLRIGEPLFPNNTFASSKPPTATVSGKLLSKTLPVRTMSCVFDAPAASKKKHGPLSIFGAFRRGSAESDALRLAHIQPIVSLGVPASPILLGRSRSATLPSKQPTPADNSQSARQQQQGPTANGDSRHAQCDNGFLPPLPVDTPRARKAVVDTRLQQRSTRLAKLETVPGSPAPYIPNGASSCTMPNPQRETEGDSDNDRALPPFPVLDDIVPATQTNLRARRLRNSSSAGGSSSMDTPVTHEVAVPRDPECTDLPPVPAYIPPGWTEEPSKVKPRHPVRKGHTFTEGELRASHQAADWREMRQHVVRFLLETEQSYVQSLRTIVKVYFEPLKSSSLIEGSLLKDIFSHIPEICAIHETFLQEVSERVEKWHHMQKIGDILINTFSRCQLMELYSAFIQNFMRAKAAVEVAKHSRPDFSKLLEQLTRDSEGKLSLNDLLIKPVQRIPRYVLFIKDLLKYTGPTHPDHAHLQRALEALTTLAERVNESEREASLLERQKELLAAVDGLAMFLTPQSSLIRYDMITEINGSIQKKDRFLILFSDLIICASTRRKSSSFRRSLINLNAMLPEAIRYKIKWFCKLTDISLAQIQTPCAEKRKLNTLEKIIENQRKDEAYLLQMLEQASGLHRPHQPLAGMLKEMLTETRADIAQKKSEIENLPHDSLHVDLISYASNPPFQYSIVFPLQRIKESWEKQFSEVKMMANKSAPPTQIVSPIISPPPTKAPAPTGMSFLHPILLHSNRVETMLTCAGVGLPVESHSTSCLWVCCSDGHSGQVCLIDLHNSTKPHQIVNITVCDSPILCMTSISTCGKGVNPQKVPTGEEEEEEGEEGGEEGEASEASSLSSQSIDTDLILATSDPMPVFSSNSSSTCSPQPTTTTVTAPPTVSHQDGFRRVRSNSAPPDPERQLDPSNSNPLGHLLGGAQADSSRNVSTQMGSEPAKLFSPLTLLPTDKSSSLCVWLGTESGWIHVYFAGCNLRSRVARQSRLMSSSVHCIKHHKDSVFVGLGNGTIAMFAQDEDISSGPRHTLAVGHDPIVSCFSVQETIWAAGGNSLYKIDTVSHSTRAVVKLPSQQTVHSVVAMDYCVCVSVRELPLVHLYHMPSNVLLLTVDITNSITDLLKGYENTLLQQRGAGLKVTSLCPFEHLLMVGTSTGVVVGLPVPPLGPDPQPLPYLTQVLPLLRGHVGRVQVMTSLKREGVPILVSGGCGCEDLMHTSATKDFPETASCLLLWKPFT